VSDLRVEFVGGGDPGPGVVAAVTALLTRPVVVVVDEDDAQAGSGRDGSTPWVRAARLEAIVPGRRIASRADLAWRR
jgi:hypothetical protein